MDTNRSSRARALLGSLRPHLQKVRRFCINFEIPFRENRMKEVPNL